MKDKKKKDILTTILPETGVMLEQQKKGNGLCNISEMFKSANEILGTNKRLDRYLNLDSTKELIEYRIKKQKSPFPLLTLAENQLLTKKEQKKLEEKVIKITKGRNTPNGRTFDKVETDLVITLDAASYLDVALRNDVYEYYLDNKRAYGNQVTETYKNLSSIVRRKISKDDKIFSDLVHKINAIVFDKAISGLWDDNCTKEQYNEINGIMCKLIGLIEEGYIQTISQLYQKLDDWYNKKYNIFIKPIQK
ncbi:MAG: hypothetical protein J6V33_03210 [Bacteroidales bacterium]|nr:hypothetical protein [Bacteroidales bacterium]